MNLAATDTKCMHAPSFARGARGELLFDEPMSRHTSWRIGGAAEYFYTPADEADLIALLSRLPTHLPRYWLGLGSNLLVRDGGLRGIVIRISRGLGDIALQTAREVRVAAGVTCAKVARFCVANALTGAEFLAGVPGTFGGALAMNAGAFGGETWPTVQSVRCATPKGEVVELAASDVKYAYREVNLPSSLGDACFLSAVLRLAPAQGGARGREKIRDLLARRGATQPIQSANAGSVFKNPKPQHAAELLQQAGLKGYRVGGAGFSSVHANFIINTGRASANDIETLIKYAQAKVKRRFGVLLQPEVRIIGRRA